MAEGETGDRTEAATPRRQDKAREDGHVPISRELATLAALVAAVGMIGLRSADMERSLAKLMSEMLRGASAPLSGRPGTVALSSIATVVLPVLVTSMVAGAVAVLLQSRFLLRLGALKPDMARVSPSAGFKRVFGANGFVELAKSLIKLGLTIGAVAVALWGDGGRMLVQLPWMSPQSLLPAIASPIVHVCAAVLCSLAVIAGADMFLVWFRHNQNLRMSKQDIRDEFKETEGNPQAKARVRRMRMQLTRRPLKEQMRKAAVVITNPTHYAVAIEYDRARHRAPRLVAKGVDHLAARIRQIARENGVPLVANPPLARALHNLEVDTEIPEEFYKAVAGVIAYVWRQRQLVGPQ